MITADSLLAVMPGCTRPIAMRYAPLLEAATVEFGINTPAQVACFISQVAHESLQLHCTREIWGPTNTQAGYEGRRDLGNVEPGDGERFIGRGLLQITGRENYRRCSLALFADERLLDHPELLEQPEPAARSAAWFWQQHGLNDLAERGNFAGITRRINGSTQTLAAREVFLRRARSVDWA